MFFPIDCHVQKTNKDQNWLVVSTHLKNISQIGNLPQIGMKMKNIWNHHLEKVQLCKDIPWFQANLGWSNSIPFDRLTWLAGESFFSH